MSIFQGNPQDLLDCIEYELFAIDYLRRTLHLHDEKAVGSVKVTLGDVASDGLLNRTVSAVGRADRCGTAVRAALSQLNPLAFSAAFKLQDMIVEWLLRANGVSAWQFAKKLSEYDNLNAAGALTSPPPLTVNSTVSKAFWELYRFFVPFRGTVVHSGGLLLQADGTVSISKGTSQLNLTSVQQASYMRAMYLIGKILSAQLSRDSFLEALIESDLCDLAIHHKQQGLSGTYGRLAALEVDVPDSQIRSAPIAFEVNFDQLRQTIKKSYPVGDANHIFFSVTITAIAGAQQFRWNLPFEGIPHGIVTIQEGDPIWDPFLTIVS